MQQFLEHELTEDLQENMESVTERGTPYMIGFVDLEEGNTPFVFMGENAKLGFSLKAYSINQAEDLYLSSELG